MSRAGWVAVGVALGSAAYPLGRIIGLLICKKSAIYPY